MISIVIHQSHFTGAWIDIDTEEFLKGERKYRQRKCTYESFNLLLNIG